MRGKNDGDLAGFGPNALRIALSAGQMSPLSAETRYTLTIGLNKA